MKHDDRHDTVFPDTRWPDCDEWPIERMLRQFPRLGPWILACVLLFLWGLAGWIAPV